MTTTVRADLVAGITTMMNAYIAANPTLLKKHLRSRPPSLNQDAPFSFCDLRPEQVHYANGLRDRILQPSVVIVDRLTDNGETMDRFDVLVDSLMDHFQAYPHIITGSIWSNMTVADEPQQEGESFFSSVRFTFTDFQKTEGRT